MSTYLTPTQKKRATKLSRNLRRSVRFSDYENAKAIFGDYHSLLSPFGEKSKNRLLKARLWLWESAIEAGELDEARKGIEIVKKRLNADTRGHLEALKLLSILEIRCSNIDLAAEYAKEAVQNVDSIKSELKRKEFHEQFIERIKEELVVSLLREDDPSTMDFQDLEMQAGRLIQKHLSANDLIAKMGAALPDHAKRLLLRVESEVRKNLPYNSIPQLPLPTDSKADTEYGSFLKKALGRRIYPLICNPKTQAQRTFTKVGFTGLIGAGNILSKAVCQAFAGFGSSAVDIASPMLATIINEKLDSFCASNLDATIL